MRWTGFNRHMGMTFFILVYLNTERMPKAMRTGDIKREWEWVRGWERDSDRVLLWGREYLWLGESEWKNDRVRETVTSLIIQKPRSATYKINFFPYRFLIPHCILLTPTSLAQWWKANCFLVEDYVTHPSYPIPYNISILPQGGLMMLLRLLSWVAETPRQETGSWWTDGVCGALARTWPSALPRPLTCTLK